MQSRKFFFWLTSKNALSKLSRRLMTRDKTMSVFWTCPELAFYIILCKSWIVFVNRTIYSMLKSSIKVWFCQIFPQSFPESSFLPEAIFLIWQVLIKGTKSNKICSVWNQKCFQTNDCSKSNRWWYSKGKFQ